MSILLVEPPADSGGSIIRRLIGQGDEVRVVAKNPRGWGDLGAHVAMGEPDGDLIERAGQHVRTLVLFDPPDELLDEAIDAARAARIERVVTVLSRKLGGLKDRLDEAGFSYVLLSMGRKFGRRRVDIAEAVDAADDLAGDVKLDLDLGEGAAWAALGIEPPF